MFRMVTQAEYENKIQSYQHQISEYQQKINFLSAERDGNLRHAQLTGDYEWGRKQAEVRTDQINQYISRINTAKNDLWEYQKQIAQEEQEQQVLAIRKAISDQVQLEQEKIIQSKQNQEIMILSGQNDNRQIINDKNAKKLQRHEQKNLQINENRQIINELPIALIIGLVGVVIVLR